MLKSKESREALSGILGTSTGIISIIAAGVIYSFVSDGSDDPLSWFNYIVGFALPAIGFAVALWFPMQWVNKRLLTTPVNHTKQES